MIKVFVLSKDGNPLMPTHPAKARVLIKQNKAKIIKRLPFTIQLLNSSASYTQNITCGIDTGYANVGFSCVSEKEELINGILKLENSMSDRLYGRAIYRRTRRNTLRYRKVRFLNRASNKKSGWLPPSIARRLETHVRLVEKLAAILPINKITIETATFDIQKIINENINGAEYQKGSLYDYENLKAFIIARENNKCQLCKKESDNTGWHLHHITPQSQGGTNKADNLALLHNICHKKLHKQKLFSLLSRSTSYKAQTFMSILHTRLANILQTKHRNVKTKFGYETKIERISNGLDKTHQNDAFIISGGNSSIKRCTSFNLTERRKNNRKLQTNRKGYAPSIRRAKYKHQPKSLVKIDSNIFTVKSTHTYGKYLALLTKSGKTIHRMVKYVNWHWFSNKFIWQYC